MLTPAALKVGSPTELAVLFPRLLGFRPEESLVVAALSGPRRRLGLTLRVDLLPAAYDEQVAAVLADGVRRSGGDEAIAVVFTRQPGVPPRLPYTSTIRHLQEHLDLLEALLVRDGRCWSYRCTDPACCPPQGRPVEETGAEATRIAAAYAATGAALLPNREALIDTLRPVAGEPAAAARAALGPAVRWRRGSSEAAVADWVDGELTRWLDAYSDPRCRLPVETAVRLAVALRSGPVRRQVGRRWLADVTDGHPDGPDRAAAWRRLLLDLVRTAAGRYRATPLALYAAAAYHEGSGILVEAAAEQALAADPRCRLAGLLLGLYDAQTPPRAALDALRDAFR